MPPSNYVIKKVERLPDSEAQVTGEIALPFLVEMKKEALKELGKNADLPGFRPGHVPEDVLIKHIGERRLLEEAAELALGREYSAIIAEAKLSPLGSPHIAITRLAPDIPLEFKIGVILEPEFDLPDYKKIAQGVADDDATKRRIKIIEALVESIKIDLPPKLIEAELMHSIAHFRSDIERAGLAWDEYLREIKKTEIDIKNDWRPRTEKDIKAHLILAKIAAKENLSSYQKVLEFLEGEKNTT